MKFIHLRTLREAVGLTQVDLARKSKVAQNTISKLETNPHSRPSHATIALLARVLRVDPDHIRFGPDPEAVAMAAARRKAAVKQARQVMKAGASL